MRRSISALVVLLVAACRPASPSSLPAPTAAVAPDPAVAHEPTAAPEADATEQIGWTPVTDEHGVVVTSRPSEHSPLPVFRGVGVVEAPLVQVLAVITDAPRHQEWIFACSASGLIAQTSDSTGIVYNRTATPWPVPDRDVVLDSRIMPIDGEREVIVRFTATEHPDRPVEDGVVRMPYLEGHYHLWAEGPDRTKVEYQVDGDPGGRLPPWLAARGTRDMPLETLLGLRKQVVRTRGEYEERIEQFRRTVLAPSQG